MLIDSHCHLNFPELNSKLDFYLQEMKINQVDYALCVGTRPDNLSQIVEMTSITPNIFASVGIHPDERLENFVLTADYLINFTKNAKVVAIGETGLDYYSVKDIDMSWQHERFILHIDVAKKVDLPLIIHTRESIKDTLAIMREHNAMQAGAVMHCFTENLDNAKKCLDLGFYLSMSGIVTFKNAKDIQEVAKYVPLDMLLIETDAPFLAPAPFRGKLNHPALVRHTAQYVADLRGISLEEVANTTSNNFFKLFKKAQKI